MTDDSAVRRELIARIEQRRATIREYVRKFRPRGHRLANLSIVCSALAAAMVIGPAAGGDSFAGRVQSDLSLSSSSVVWRTLCLGALLVSVAAAILTSLNKSQDLSARVSAAESCSVDLEGLQNLLEFSDLSVDDGVKLYQHYLAKIPFVEDARVSSR